MFTITLGVQKSYKDEDFYTVNNKFASEEIRVNELFKNSKNKGEIIFINQKNQKNKTKLYFFFNLKT